MTEEWHKIPSFPEYEMTEHSMRVRRIDTQKELNRIDEKYYTLRAEGTSYMRSAKVLYGTTFRKEPLPDSNDPRYRVLPEFPTYEITQDGDVRHRRKVQLLTEVLTKNSGYYNLWKNGKTYSRGTYGLICSAWPEIANLPSKWRDIPGYPNYQMDKEGNVWNKRQSMSVRVWNGQRQKGPSVRLRHDDKYHWFILEELKKQVWPVESEEENAA